MSNPLDCDSKNLTALDAYEQARAMFNEFMEKFPEDKEIRGVSIHEDGTLPRKRRIGYFFFVDFADGSQVMHEFSWPYQFVKDNFWYCGVFVGMITEKLSNLAPELFSTWIMQYGDKRSTLQERLV